MAFVNERVSKEEQAKLDPAIFYRPYSWNKEPIEAYQWTIDRERDAFLIVLDLPGSGGGQGDGYIPPYRYALSWKGMVVKFDARGHSTGNTRNGDAVVTWEVSNICLPDDINAKKPEVLQLIQEAFEETGVGCQREGVLEVTVFFK
jgi:hypothetical protein